MEEVVGSIPTRSTILNPPRIHHLRVEHAPIEHALEESKGPAIVTLYDAAKDGPLPSAYTKVISGGLFKEVADVVLNGEGIVEVLTSAHPHGELIGLVQMHKSYK